MNIKQLAIIILLIFSNSLVYAGNYVVRTKADVQNVIMETAKNHSSGNFLTFITDIKSDVHFVQLGNIPGFKRFSAVYRNRSCWMVPAIGTDLKDLPIETQFMIIDCGDSEYLMLIPLVDAKTRCSLGGLKSGELELIAETGDTLTSTDQFLGLYMLSGTDPQQMIKKATKEIQLELKSFKLRKDKKEPWFVNYFGWCTYNALYGNLSKDTLAYAMKNFCNEGIPVKYVIIDAGWQSNKNDLLNSFYGDKGKFPEGIGETISMLKNEYGVKEVIMWQTLWGMFKGLYPSGFPNTSQEVSFLPPRRMDYLLKIRQKVKPEEATVGPQFYPGFVGRNIYIPDNFYSYYNTYFNYLRREGADGVKVDAITWIEATGNNRGGRVAVMKDMMNGLQSTDGLQFNNELLNCSSCSNDYLFNTLTANVTRSSADFSPDRPKSHTFHVYTNAHTSFWMGDIVLCDWDMFQSGSEGGAFHAAARAISGGPVYISDKIESEDKNILDKLMCSNGRLPRCKDVGRVCTESLFTDPAKSKKAIKIYNTNLVGGIVGAFNCSYSADKSVIVTEEIKASDIENLEGTRMAVYQYSTDNLSLVPNHHKIPVKLKKLGFDLFTFVPIENGFAPIGIVGKYNPGGMIDGFNLLSEDIVSLKLLEGGKFVAWSERKPKEIFANGQPISFNYDNNKIEADVPKIANVMLTIKFK